MTTSGVGKLLREPREWDKAIVFIRNRQPIVMDETSEPAWVDKSEGTACLTISSDEAVDPLYNPQQDGQQPRICTHTITVGIEDIVSIDYIKYPRIMSGPSSKIILS